VTCPVRTYWAGSRFVVEWTIVDDAGDPVSGATVVGEVRPPSGGSTAMSVTSSGNVFTAGYTAAAAGLHGWALTASGTAEGEEQGTFRVARDTAGLPPITVDPSTDIGRVRLLATDLNDVDPLFEDTQIGAFLTIESGNVKRAAALALETIAVSEVLVSKKITTSDGLSTDGPAVAKELRDRAAALRKQSDEEVGDPDDYGIDVVEYDPYAAYRDAWW